MKKYLPLIRQHDETDCGAACMSMILQYFGKKLPLSTLREDARVDQYGSNLYGLKQTAERYGLEANALEGTAQDFLSAVESREFCLPVIVRIVSQQGFEHFIVVSSVRGSKVYCCDPGEGRYALSTDAFSQIFLGQVMVFVKTPAFVRENLRRGSITRYFQLISNQKALLFTVAALSVLVTGVGLLGSYIFQFLVDQVMGNLGDEYLLDENLEAFALLVVAVAVAYLFRFLFQMLRGRLMAYMTKRINLPLMLGYYDHVIELPMSFFSTRKTGDLISRFNDASKIQEALSNATLTLLIDTVMVVFCGVVLYRRSAVLFFVTLGIMVLYALVSLFYIPPVARRSRQLLVENGELSSYLKESIDGVQTIKAFQAEGGVKDHMHQLFVTLQNDGIKFAMLGLSKNALIELIASVGVLVLLWVGTIEVIGGALTLGSLITFYTLLSYFLTPMQDLIELQSDIQEAVAAADRLNDVLDAAAEEVSPKPEQDAPFGDLVFDHVSFRYGNRQMVLQDLSFCAKRGEHVALIGSSGSGKTTVAKVLMGFYQIESGAIRIGGHCLEELGTVALRRKIAYVPQETFLFSGTIRENLLLGGIEADDATLQNLLAVCGCAFIDTLPFGLDTALEENGANLSGGQRQRLAIVRALLRQPELLILDEATSNLDALSERKIMEAIRLLDPEMTVLMSAHRLNTVRSCNSILILDNGAVAESGTHETLLRQDGLYRQMWDAQHA